MTESCPTSIAAFALAECYKAQRDATTFSDDECDLVIRTLDLYLASSTDMEILRDGDMLLDLRNRFTANRNRMQTPGLPFTVVEALARP